MELERPRQPRFLVAVRHRLQAETTDRAVTRHVAVIRQRRTRPEQGLALGQEFGF